MKIKVIDQFGKKTKDFDISDELFGRKYNESLIHQLVVSYQSNARSGTRAQKDRSMVKASTRKPWKQKGTGRARAGTVASPIWRGGGRVFPSDSSENFKKKINKKMYKIGMSSILSRLLTDKRLLAVESFDIDSHKTKLLSDKVKNLGMDSFLLITHKIDKNLELSSRNLPNIDIISTNQLNPVSLLKSKKTLLTIQAIEKIQENLI